MKKILWSIGLPLLAFISPGPAGNGFMAQRPKPKEVSTVKALKIGQKIPEAIWKTPLQVLNSPQKTTTLNDDKDKIIIIDFWATWCSACLLNFPKMEQLQAKFGSKIKILAVTRQDRATIDRFFSTENGKKYNHMLTVTDDQLLSTLIPHKAIPYIAWFKDGRLLNTTDAEQVTATNIQQLLDGEQPDLQTVQHISRDRPLFLSQDFDRQRHVDLLNYSFFAKGHIPDVSAGGTYRKNEKNITYGWQFTNLPLSNIYFTIGYELFQKFKVKEKFTEKRMLLQIQDVEKLNGIKNPDGTYSNQYIFNYEFLVAPEKANFLFDYMLNDLNRYTDFNAAVEKRKVPCLVLKKTTAENKIATQGGEMVSTFPQSPSILKNAPLSHMVNMINGKTNIALPMIDETGITGNVDLEVSGINNVDQLNRELHPYGLQVIVETRELYMLIITDQSPSKQ